MKKERLVEERFAEEKEEMLRGEKEETPHGGRKRIGIPKPVCRQAGPEGLASPESGPAGSRGSHIFSGK